MKQIFWQPGITLEEIQNNIIKTAFAYYKQNKTQTSQSLGIAIRTLEIKLKKMADDEAAQKEQIHTTKFERRNQLARERGIQQISLEQFNAEEAQKTLNDEFDRKNREEHDDYVARTRRNNIGIKTYGALPG
jgi:hypothetical protein